MRRGLSLYASHLNAYALNRFRIKFEVLFFSDLVGTNVGVQQTILSTLTKYPFLILITVKMSNLTPNPSQAKVTSTAPLVPRPPIPAFYHLQTRHTN